ncbi:hypothetical protein MNBD_ALPHA11-802 [hydrothermal vent metagenome]|uniref:Uncharacterized protein n=1 Tax=hydrothermal vent metagenome TaxID=652676 RepID=A0A3B0U4K9_9ZZZZ
MTKCPLGSFLKGCERGYFYDWLEAVSRLAPYKIVVLLVEFFNIRH